MIGLEEWVDAVSLHRQGLSIKAISRRLRMSRNAVRRALRRDGPPKYERPLRPSKLDPYRDYLLDRLAEFPELTAASLLDEIKSMGYTGGVSILKEFTLPHRRRRKEPVVRFETPPGKQAQADFANLGRHEINGEPAALYLFVMVLGFSRMIYAEITTGQGTEALIGGHVRAFAFFGGTPEEVLYDNAKCVVLSRGSSGPRFHPALLDLAGRYGFVPRLCRPYRAKTKGKVERTIGYIKDRFFTGRTFTDIEDANRQLLAWLESTANVRIHKTTGERPVDRLKREKLAPLPPASAAKLPASPNAKKRPLFSFRAPEIEKRPLSVYEEVCR